MEFEMSINTGIQALKTYDDLADSLKRVRNRFDESDMIIDYNDNKIGIFYWILPTM